MAGIKEIEDFSKEELRELVRDAALNWLAHDGLWFRAIEDKYGLDAATESIGRPGNSLQ